MLYVHKHMNTSPRDDNCGRSQYDEHDDHGELDIKGSADLWTSLQTASLTERVQGVCEPPGDSHLHMWIVGRKVLHIHNSPKLEATASMR